MKRFAKMNLSTVSHGDKKFGTFSQMKNSESLKALKDKIKYWKPDNFPCRIFRFYTSNIGFV